MEARTPRSAKISLFEKKAHILCVLDKLGAGKLKFFSKRLIFADQGVRASIEIFGMMSQHYKMF